MTGIIDLVWQKFWKLVVASLNRRENSHTYRNCNCDCGGKTVVRGNSIKTWWTKSCWCLSSRLRCNMKSHLMKGTRIYNIYCWIKQRCEYKKSNRYYCYWWRGIRIERKNFKEFANDMLESYSIHVEKFWEKDTTIDRIDNNLNYCKHNCRRATRLEQLRNRRKKFLPHNII